MKVVVGISGGVDSALSAYLLKEQGHEVTGAMMLTWDKSMPIPPVTGGCLAPEEEDLEAAQSVAKSVGIPLVTVNLAKEFSEIVLKNFKQEYASGRTPNPCLICNQNLKFGLLMQGVKKQGVDFDKFATGHYSRISYDENLKRFQLKTASDIKKDQSYFLYRLNQEQLSKIIFPLSELPKTEVRKLAEKYKLPVAKRQDSQDFYAGDYKDILQFKPKRGDIVDKTGKVLGHHEGIWNFTIGKRKGLLGGGTKEPIYVIGLDSCHNRVIVGGKQDVFSKEIIVENINWVSIPPTEIFKAQVKIRAQHKPADAEITVKDNTAKVIFAEPQMAVTPGQSAVFYNGDILLAGGVIK